MYIDYNLQSHSGGGNDAKDGRRGTEGGTNSGGSNNYEMGGEINDACGGELREQIGMLYFEQK